MSIKDVRFGYDFPADINVKGCMDCIQDWELTFACVPLSNLRLKAGDCKPSDTVLNPEFSRKWCHCVVAKVSQPPPDGGGGGDSEPRERFVRDVSWAAFLNVFSVMFDLPLDTDLVHLVRLLDNQIDAYLESSVSLQFWIAVPVCSAAAATVPADTWHKWSRLVSMARNADRIKLALRVGPELPADDGTLDRWLGEPVTALLVDTRSFVVNRKGFPVLPKRHQAFLKKMFNVGAQLIVSGPSAVRQHFNYLAHLYENTAPLTPYASDYISGYEDYLQTPLQPLQHDLQSAVYETFEQDPVKYQEYRRAIGMALADKAAVAAGSGEAAEMVVYVLGAGRGPLVDAALDAADERGVRVRVCAVEKNKNALPTLYAKNAADKWRDRVTVECADMRHWRPADKCDVMVSELLGSFGDNELSPECLDGAQRYLKDDGVCIPCSYTSYVGPVQSRKLHAEIASIKRKEQECNFQRPYVVQLNNVYTIAAAKPLFTFVHPRPMDGGERDDNANDRDGNLSFDVPQDCILHGLAGYFDTVLYKDVRLSIVPETFSQGMFSWFPAYFPLTSPVALTNGDRLRINFWRFADKHKVWYEWCASLPKQTVIHNVNGTTYSMSL